MFIHSRNLILLLVLSFFGIHSAGCGVFLLGAGAAGGYAISSDTVEYFSDLDYDRVWTAVQKTLEEQGIITLDSKATGLMEAKVDGSVVKTTLEKVTSKSNRLRIKARRAKELFPDIKLAQRTLIEVIKKVE